MAGNRRYPRLASVIARDYEQGRLWNSRFSDRRDRCYGCLEGSTGLCALIANTVGVGSPPSENPSNRRPAAPNACSSSGSGQWLAPTLSRTPWLVQDAFVQWLSRQPGRITTAYRSARSAKPPQKHGWTPMWTNTPPG